MKSLKLQAAAFVAAFILGIVGIQLAIAAAVAAWGIEVLGIIAVSALLAITVKFMYELRLGQLEARELARKHTGS